MRLPTINIVVLGAGLFLSPMARDVPAIGQTHYVTAVNAPGSFPIAKGNDVATICVAPNDWPGVVRAANDLQANIMRVTGRKSEIVHGTLKENSVPLTQRRSPK